MNKFSVVVAGGESGLQMQIVESLGDVERTSDVIALAVLLI